MPTMRCQIKSTIANMSPADQEEFNAAIELAALATSYARLGDQQKFVETVKISNKKLGKHLRGVFVGYVLASLGV